MCEKKIIGLGGLKKKSPVFIIAELLHLHFPPYSESFPDTEESTFLAVIWGMSDYAFAKGVLLCDTIE